MSASKVTLTLVALIGFSSYRCAQSPVSSENGADTQSQRSETVSSWGGKKTSIEMTFAISGKSKPTNVCFYEAFSEFKNKVNGNSVAAPNDIAILKSSTQNLLGANAKFLNIKVLGSIIEGPIRKQTEEIVAIETGKLTQCQQFVEFSPDYFNYLGRYTSYKQANWFGLDPAFGWHGAEDCNVYETVLITTEADPETGAVIVLNPPKTRRVSTGREDSSCVSRNIRQICSYVHTESLKNAQAKLAGLRAALAVLSTEKLQGFSEGSAIDSAMFQKVSGSTNVGAIKSSLNKIAGNSLTATAFEGVCPVAGGLEFK